MSSQEAPVLEAPQTDIAGGLSAEQRAAFDRDGFLLVRGVIDPAELAIIRAAAEGITGPAIKTPFKSPDYNYHHDPLTGKLILQRVNRLISKGDVWLKLHGHPRLLAMAHSVFGPDFIAGGFDMVIKSPGYGASVHWHRDPAYCRIDHGTNMGIYFDDATPENGMLYAIPGSHKRNDIDLQEQIEEHGFHIPGSIPVPAKAGDVLLHCENVLHGSRLVRGNGVRRVLYYGVRSIREQLARGLDAGWVRNVGRLAVQNTRLRARDPMFAHETPYVWQPSNPEWRVEVEEGEFVETRLTE
jgi:ectoine hydroxylase-related dioxygenase (phytanoyl-CoA dioxygenase family)